MFGNNTKKGAVDEIVKSSTIIGKGTVIEGNIDTAGNISIDGKLLGNIRCKAKIHMGVQSELEGNLYAQTAEIAGHVKGTVEVTDLLIIKPTAVIDGDVVYGKIQVEEGVINGTFKKLGGVVKEINLSEQDKANERQARAKEKSA